MGLQVRIFYLAKDGFVSKLEGRPQRQSARVKKKYIDAEDLLKDGCPEKEQEGLLYFR